MKLKLRSHVPPEALTVLVASTDSDAQEQQTPGVVLHIHDANPPGRVGRVSTESGRTDDLEPAGALRELWAATFIPRLFLSRDEQPKARKIFGVIARWIVRGSSAEDFERALQSNMRQSVAKEDGCSGFGYGQVVDGTSRGSALDRFAGGQEYVLVEIFRDRESFAAHLAQEHFMEFRQATASSFLGDRAVTTAGYGWVNMEAWKQFI
jgi:quinol monooxygenase YgiN